MTFNSSRIKSLAVSKRSLLVRLLRDIVKIKSPSGEERGVAGRIKSEMKDSGFDSVSLTDSGSVIGRIGNGRKKILYDAHIDTVGIGDIKNWTYNPYGAVYSKGVVHGRGACDDKGSVAAMVFAGRLIKELGLEEDYTLYISASALEEEADGRGIKEVIGITGKPDYVIIGEPSGLKIIRGHKGRIGARITAKGKSVHASTPDKGVNAIYKMTSLVSEVEKMNKILPSNSILGSGTVCVTSISSGSASHNTVPDSCTAYLDRRVTEKETKQKVMGELNKLAGKQGKVEIVNRFFPAWVLDNGHPMLKAATRAYSAMFGRKPVVSLWPFCTNGSYSMGEKGFPTLGFGPGNEKLCHVPNERIKIDEVLQASMFYALFPSMF